MVRPKTLVLKAAAFSGLANNTSDSALKLQYEMTAKRSLQKSILTSHGTQDESNIIRFARDTPALSEMLQDTAQQKQDAMLPKGQ